MKRLAAVLALVALTTACTARTEAAVPTYTPPSLSLGAQTGQVQQHAGPIVDGKVPQVRRIAVDKPFVFLTIDDGAVPDPDAPRLIRESGAHPILFLNDIYVRGHEDYFKQVLAAGATLGDHTVNHPDLKGKSLAYQQKEICDDADDLARALGVRPVFFRPPFGSWDDNTLKAAANCGMRVSVLWTASVNDGRVDFQEGKRLQPGYIVLMHFRKTFAEDFTAFVNQSEADGLTPVALADFLG